MTQTEQQFYSIFNIDETFEITDHVLLELICILCNYDDYFHICRSDLINIDSIKLSVLHQLNFIYQQGYDIKKKNMIYNEIHNIMKSILSKNEGK